MDVFAEVAQERLAVAELAAGLTAEELATPSLCAGWTVHDVLAHLVMPLETGLVTFGLAMVRARGDFDRANDRLTRQTARRPSSELVEVLRQRAGSRFTPPGSGPEAPLTDLLVHGCDVRWPLGRARDLPADRTRTALTYLTTAAATPFVPRGRLDGLALTTTDLDWAHGTGAEVRGSTEAVLLAVTGRPPALDRLDGDGVPVLRSRIS